MLAFTRVFRAVLILSWMGVFLLALSACSEDEYNGNSGRPNDPYVGDCRVFELSEELDGFMEKKPVLYIMAPDGQVFVRTTTHQRTEDRSLITMDHGIKEGVYRMLFLEYEGDLNRGLGMRIEFKKDGYRVLDSYDEQIGLVGKGTQEDPYQVTAPEHLTKIRSYTNSHPTEGLYFSQQGDFIAKYMKPEVERCDPVHFWTPIGYDMNNPFCGIYNGNGYYIEYVKSLTDKVENGVAVGLFGYIRGATILNVTIKNSMVKGVYGVGTLAGVVITRGGTNDTTHIHKCSLISSDVYGANGSFSAGGLIGVVDSHAVLDIAGCSTDDEVLVTADYNAGGLVGAGAVSSKILINNCQNNGSVKVNLGSAGGIIAVGDTISIVASKNLHKAQVVGPETNVDDTQRSFGGILAGARAAWITTSENYGTVKGYEGVGGIVGSMRVNYSEEEGYLFNNVYLRYCRNEGDVSGVRNVGGLCGEAQFGCYSCLNTGTVQGVDYVGGLVGYTSIAGVHNSLNKGSVSGTGDYVAGIVGKTSMGSLADSQNYGSISAEGSHAAGIVGYAENNTVIHYCGNFGAIEGMQEPVGGIVAEMGREKELSALNIAEITFGAVQMFAAFLGPVLSVAHMATSGFLSTFLLLTEVAIDVVLPITEVVFIGIAGHHLDHVHVEAMAAEIVAVSDSVIQSLDEDLKKIRASQSVKLLSDLSTDPLLTDYATSMDELSGFLSNEENVKTFNDNLNKAVHERAEEVAELNEIHERNYIIAAGVLLAVDVISVIGLTVLSGGTLAPAIVGGMIGAVGAMNSITKGATDYADNVILITQCVNAGPISGTPQDHVGGIVGRFNSRGYMKDCLNAGTGTGKGGGQLAGLIDDEYSVINCLGLADVSTWKGIFGEADGKIGTYDTFEGVYYYKNKGYTDNYASSLSLSQLGQQNSYSGWSFGEQGAWKIPTVTSGTSYPIPFRSSMQFSAE